jgi:hypothetical protein
LLAAGAASGNMSRMATRKKFRISQNPWRWARGRGESVDRPKEKWCSP